MLRSDAGWLRDNNIMDYSLLLGIHEEGEREGGGGGGGGMVGGSAGTSTASITSTTSTSTDSTSTSTSTRTSAANPAVPRWPRQLMSVWEADAGGLRAREAGGAVRGETYFMGVIDILQEYDIKKKLEHEYKAHKQIKKGHDPNAISAVKSSVYAKRFVDYMARNIV